MIFICRYRMVLSGKIDVLACAKTGSQPLCSQNALHKKKNALHKISTILK